MPSPENNRALASLELTPPLPLPNGCSEADMLAFFGSVTLAGSPRQELENYWRQDWRRFVYTYGLVSESAGRCLELGANPYFTTSLLKEFTRLDLTLANYFGPHFTDQAMQEVSYSNPKSGKTQKHCMQFFHFNIEAGQFPFEDGAFDTVLFCEVLEHLQSDPLRVLLEIKRVLKEGGHLVLTTPNVSRIENVCRMIAGENIYDPYSGYGPYGRHNREYNKHELSLLLRHCGFEVESMFSADVHENAAGNFYPVEQILELVRSRQHDLGQYLFSRTRNAGPPKDKRPAWLFRSYPLGELDV
jgi:SAM-dependent methyltransferase